MERRRGLPRRLKAAVTVLGLMCSLLVVWGSSQAVFTATTSNPTNTWAAGTIGLSDDDGGTNPTTGTAMFRAATGASNMKPGTPLVHCIRVQYDGTYSTGLEPVKLYTSAAATGTGLENYLDITIEEGDGATFGPTCAGFVATGTAYGVGVPAASPGTLSDFDGKNNYAAGVGTWVPNATTATKSYRFTISVQNNDLAQGKTATVTFVWELQTS